VKYTIAMISALFLLTQGTCMAARAGRDRIERGMMGYENRYDCSSLTANTKLKLTAVQAARLRALDEICALEMEPIREQLHDKRRALKAEWLQTEPDRGRIKVMQGEAAKLRDRLRAKLSEHRAGVLMILTPEQQAHLLEDMHGRIFNKPAGPGWQ
jgi:Spy/CpxP family protein refolding chaperone